ncbi:uncharacterized protein LOC122060449 [Macadamia integrifolia]|uniref:uncharacterized protein LOC122060449 n=1 Tax=Macadamia integrifolia TaxID=60698 RepID=UPI001C528FDF|nr:uncharacterized protein LOC122060449 [Macadamia integrifolia]XP_042479473.1 uncharacterized protein LOC122060449 [Macadamia integrifolia]
MESFNETSGFRYNPSSEAMVDLDGDREFSGLLEIFVHHARNIHNICIYNKQDVYAKFSLTYSPDETLSTRIINGGGKNPEFNENLRMKITQLDAVLKCEIWMLSRARNYMEDQLLGFTLVPMSLVAGKGKVSQDFTLSSTDLFHSPAGTVKMTLFLDTSLPVNSSAKSFSDSPTNSSISSEVVLLDPKNSEELDPVEYGRIEFPDINVVKENQKMVSEYFNIADHSAASRLSVVGPASFLHLGACSESVDDYDMTVNSSEENYGGSISPSGSKQNSGFFSTTTSLSDDRNSVDSMEKKSHVASDIPNSNVEAHQISRASPDTPTSKKGIDREEKEASFTSKEEEDGSKDNLHPVELGPAFTAPLGNINLEAEQNAMQRQIVDMYMRSMQQFTESLEKMKLPMDLDKLEPDKNGVVIHTHNKNLETDKKKKDGSRVFYGSRAFF